MMLSMTTDYAKGTGCPEPYLRRISEAGFSHVHWCHQWNTDFLYTEPEIAQIERWLKEFHLQVLDLHASDGPEKRYVSALEYERLAGVELIRNRIEMTARLGGDVIILHASEPPDEAQKTIFWTQLRKSLDELHPIAKKSSVRIAIENGVFSVIERILSEYAPDYVGICYDSGHGNMGDHTGLDHVERLKGRLISVHLHDNDGASDQHKPMFSGTVDWPRLARIMATSSYAKCVSQELALRCVENKDEAVFLRQAFEAGIAFTKMIADARA